jgi:hypothetical protein
VKTGQQGLWRGKSRRGVINNTLQIAKSRAVWLDEEKDS